MVVMVISCACRVDRCTVAAAACAAPARRWQNLTARRERFRGSGGCRVDEDVIEVDLLGSLEVRAAGRDVALRSGMQRALLATLALAEGEPVSIDALTEAMWGDDEPPSDPRSSIQSYVSRLRAEVGDGVVVHGPGGYRLAGHRTDVVEVRDLAGRARAAGDPREAAELLQAALDRWRGEPLGELAAVAALRPDAARLAELRALLVDEHASALLDAGEAGRAVPELERAVARDPLRETTQLLLVRALAAAGRSADALRAADRYRRRLVEDTGLEPGPELAELEQRVLAGERPGPRPSVGGPPVDAPGPGSVALPRLGSFVGREHELERLAEHLRSEPLVTVVGPGGVGKTRLVAEALQRDDRPTVAVELAAATHGQVASTVAAAAGLALEGPDLEREVVTWCASQGVRLVLDAAEHLLDEVRGLTHRVLAAGGRPTVVVTSRTRLGLPGEQVLPLDPLPVPDPSAPDAEVVELFLDRARRADPRLALGEDVLPLVAKICARLDGLPLAIELAAGRVGALGLAELHDHLDEALDLLVGSSPSRAGQLSLRDVVAWSDHLLDAESARALRCLAVLEPGFSLDAAGSVAAVAAADPALAVAGLVDASLLQVDHIGGTTRYRLLDTVRAYAVEGARQADLLGPAEAARAQWAQDVISSTAAAIPGPDEAAAVRAARAQRANLAAGLRRVLDVGEPSAVEAVAAAAARVVLYHPEVGLLTWLTEAVRVPGALEGDHAATVLAGAARAAWHAGRLHDAEDLAGRALNAVEADPATVAMARHALAVAHLYQGRLREAGATWSQVVADAEAPAPDRADALAGTALARTYAGDLAGAEEPCRELADLVTELGSDTYAAMHAYVCGERALAAGDPEAVTWLERSLDLAEPSDARFVSGLAGTALASALVRAGRLDDARPRLVALLRRLHRGSTWPQTWTAVRLVAEAVVDDDPGTAAALVRAAAHDPAAPATTGADAARVAALAGADDLGGGGPVLDRGGAVAAALRALGA
jgi:predicted ATPase/DNA-binding SARP family transcriptional activator